MDVLQEQMNEVEKFARREVDYYERMEKGDQQIWKSVQSELASL